MVSTTKTRNFNCTSHAGPVRGVHGGHWLRDSGRVTHATLVDGAHTEEIRATLHQTSHRETGELYWCVVALDPVVGSDLTPAQMSDV